MYMKVIMTGSTGMIGKGVLLECIESEAVTDILVINRNPINMSHPKVKEIIDFFPGTEVEQIEEK